MWENVRVKVSEQGKEKDIQWGGKLGVSVQSTRSVGKENKAFGILGRQDLR